MLYSFVHLALQTYLEAAKTRFKKDYKSLNSSKITTTVGLNIGQVDVAGIRINFWDLGGQEDLQSLWDKVSPGLIRVIFRNLGGPSESLG